MSILDIPVNVTSNRLVPTISAGSNRLVLVTECMYNGAGNATAPTSQTINGVSGIFIAGDNTANSRVASATFLYKEANISSISGQLITISGQSGTVRSTSVMSLQGLSQDTPTATTKAYASTTGTLTLPLTRSSGSYTVLLGYTSTNSQPMNMTNPTRDGNINFSNGTLSYAYEADTAQTTNSTVAGSNNTTAHVINFTSPPAQSIINVNGDNTLSSGTTNNVIQTDGFTTTPNTVTIGGYSASSIVWSSGTEQVNFNFPTYIDGVAHPEPDTEHELVCSSGSESDNIIVHLNPISGHDSVVISGAIDNDSTYIGYHYILNDSDRLIYPSEGGEFSVVADGGVTASVTGTRVVWHWNNSTEMMTQLNITVNESGIVSVTTGKVNLGIGLGIGI
jgi:hypothetical protein